jgi:type III secretion system low calcium response chaperone LcrH/SycD
MQESTTAAEPSARPSDVVLAGGTFADAAGMGPRALEAIYGLAYQEMEQQHFAEAERTLRALCLTSHTSPRYWMALGACRQKMGAYEDAIYAYSMVAELGHADPMAPLRAAECYLMLGLYEEALSGIESALTLAVYADDPSAVIQHLEVLVEALDKAGGKPSSAKPESR